MKHITKIAGICVLTFGLAACGGGGGGGSSVGGNGGSNGAGSGGTPVASRTGEANYVGTFNATATPLGQLSSGGKTYKGGEFTGRVIAEADFDEDQIDVDLIGTPKGDIITRYEAEFDDARISGREFSGRGTENIVANGGSLTSNNGAKIDGSFNGDGSKISGKTESDLGSVNIETDFSASEK